MERFIDFTFTVLVCTRDRPRELESCLASVRLQEYTDFEVLVVDSASRGTEARDVAERWGARYIREPLPGVSRARNVGARASTSNLIAMIDDEAVADPSWLTNLAREFADPEVQSVAGRIRTFEAHSAEERFCALLGGADGGENRQVVDRSGAHWFERACFGGVGSGANLAFRRQAFDLWPGFCESLGAGARIVGGEEHYAFFGLVDLGYRVVYAPEAIVSHPFPRTLQALQERHLRYLAASVGYIALLFVDQPRYRRRVLKYVLEAACGVRREWREGSGVPRVRISSRWKSAGALVAGVANYLRHRWDEAFTRASPCQASTGPSAEPGHATPAALAVPIRKRSTNLEDLPERARPLA